MERGFSAEVVYAVGMFQQAFHRAGGPLVALAAVSCFAGSSRGQSIIHICGTDFRIGMAKTRVLDIAGRDCQLQRTKGFSGDTWAFREGNDAPWDGFMTFQDGSLTYLSKDVAQGSGKAVENIASKLYSFIQDAESNGQAVAVSLRREETLPDPEGGPGTVRSRMLGFAAGDKKLYLWITQPASSAKTGFYIGVHLEETTGGGHRPPAAPK